MIDAILTNSEREAVSFLAEYEITKIAADKRCVSEHTQKNQIKAAMRKLGVNTQIGLVKEFFRIIYGVEFHINDVRQVLATMFLCLFLSTLGNTDQLARRNRRVRRSETELIIDDDGYKSSIDDFNAD